MRSRRVTLEESIVKLAAETGASAVVRREGPRPLPRPRHRSRGQLRALHRRPERSVPASRDDPRAHRRRAGIARCGCTRTSRRWARSSRIISPGCAACASGPRRRPEAAPRPRRARSGGRAGARRFSVARLRGEGDAGDHERASEHEAQREGSSRKSTPVATAITGVAYAINATRLARACRKSQ